MKTRAEIEALMDEALEKNGKFSGMTYEEGIEAACRWILGMTQDRPMED